MAAYKDGDSRTINGITYVRQNGQWLPQGGSPAIGPAIGNNPLIPFQVQAAQGQPQLAGVAAEQLHGRLEPDGVGAHAEHFPRSDADSNEIPDKLIEL